MFAPSFARRSAMALPIPLAPPVTTAVLPFNGMTHSSSQIYSLRYFPSEWAWPYLPPFGSALARASFLVKGVGATRLPSGHREQFTFSILLSASRHQLQAVHCTISFALPSLAFIGQSGSQSKGRHNPMISAFSCWRISSAIFWGADLPRRHDGGIIARLTNCLPNPFSQIDMCPIGKPKPGAHPVAAVAGHGIRRRVFGWWGCIFKSASSRDTDVIGSKFRQFFANLRALEQSRTRNGEILTIYNGHRGEPCHPRPPAPLHTPLWVIASGSSTHHHIYPFFDWKVIGTRRGYMRAPCGVL